MPSLRSMLYEYDLDFLSRIARSWNVTISQKDLETALADLLLRMNNAQTFKEMHISLDGKSLIALDELLVQGGVIPLELFSHKHGEIRSLGPAKRAREEPDLHPISISEKLWYSGLIGKAFLNFRGEVREVVFIPDEIMTFLHGVRRETDNFLIRPAVTQTPRVLSQASSTLLDRAADLLASMRMGRGVETDIFDQWKLPRPFLVSLLQSSGLLGKDLQPNHENLKDFLQSGRTTALAFLFQTWLNTKEINDLRLIPGLEFDGYWRNDPIPPRQFLIGILGSLGEGTWYSIASLLAEIKQKRPDFQRYAGEYDSWFIRKAGEKTYLSGFEHWEDVEGALLRFILCGPLHWFGILDLARGSADGKVMSFRVTTAGNAFLQGKIPEVAFTESGLIEFKQVDTYLIQDFTPLQLRYQAARFGRLIKFIDRFSWYRLTPDSLKAAASQGLNLRQFIQLLEKNQPKPIPKSLQRLAERWEGHHLEASIQSGVLLRFVSAEVCSLFLASPRSSAMVLEKLNPQTLLLNPNSQEAARRLLAEMGILTQTEAVV